MRVVPALDELEDGHLGFGLRLKAPPGQQFALQAGKDAFREFGGGLGEPFIVAAAS